MFNFLKNKDSRVIIKTSKQSKKEKIDKIERDNKNRICPECSNKNNTETMLRSQYGERFYKCQCGCEWKAK